MKDEILFEITKENLETGLRGYPVGYCTTSFVDPQKGLFYIGQPIKDLSTKEPIEVIYLLYHGAEGTNFQIEAFNKEIKKRSFLEESYLKYIYALPKKGHPMDLFCAAIQILGMQEKKKEYREDCLDIIAKVPIVAAAVLNHHYGWGEEIAFEPELGYMENFVQMLNCDSKDRELFTKLMKLFNILHYDHGGGNLSAFVGKAVASGHQHMYGSIVAAMNALAGPLHGRANQDCLAFVKKIHKELGEDATKEEMEHLLRKKIKEEEIIYGFGHAVLRMEDPRASLFYSFAEEHFPNHPLVKSAFLLREVGPKVLSENEKISDPYPNVDAISGTLLTAAGFPYAEGYTLLFGLSRCVGIAIQIVYERLEAREGKGTPIVRPRYIFKSKK